MYRILLVEDDEALRYVYARMNAWQENGFCLAAQAANGKQALEQLDKERFDLIVTDIRMPFVDGLELLRELRRRAIQTPVILVSSYGEFEYAREGLVLGAFDYIVKPFCEEQLNAVLSRAAQSLSAHTGEDSQYALVRETLEQLGIPVQEDGFVHTLAAFLAAHLNGVITMEQAAEHLGLSKGLFRQAVPQSHRNDVRCAVQSGAGGVCQAAFTREYGQGQRDQRTAWFCLAGLLHAHFQGDHRLHAERLPRRSSLIFSGESLLFSVFTGFGRVYDRYRSKINEGGENVENYVITIARGFGSGGKQIGKLLASQLGIPCYESQIPQMASECSGISQEKFMQADERLRRPSLLRLIRKAPDIDRAYALSDRKFVSDDNLFRIQAWIIRELAKSKPCIIVGKCANHILRDRANVLSVYVEAPRKTCVESIMQKSGVTAEQAKQIDRQNRSVSRRVLQILHRRRRLDQSHAVRSDGEHRQAVTRGRGASDHSGGAHQVW